MGEHVYITSLHVADPCIGGVWFIGMSGLALVTIDLRSAKASVLWFTLLAFTSRYLLVSQLLVLKAPPTHPYGKYR